MRQCHWDLPILGGRSQWTPAGPGCLPGHPSWVPRCTPAVPMAPLSLPNATSPGAPAALLHSTHLSCPTFCDSCLKQGQHLGLSESTVASPNRNGMRAASGIFNILVAILEKVKNM